MVLVINPRLNSNSQQIEIQVRQYQQDDFPAISKIFKEGMMYYADRGPGKPTSNEIEKYVSDSLNADLKDIYKHYMDNGGNFWVATIQDSIENEPIVVGMIALEKVKDNMAELRRMSVGKNYRRFGIGRRLVTTLENWARDHDFNGVMLSTGGHMPQAVTFYESMGYDVYLRNLHEIYKHETVYLHKIFNKVES